VIDAAVKVKRHGHGYVRGSLAGEW
jgi:hypothetical protein